MEGKEARTSEPQLLVAAEEHAVDQERKKMKDDDLLDVKRFGVLVCDATEEWRLVFDGPSGKAWDVYEREHDRLKPGEKILLLDGKSGQGVAKCGRDVDGRRTCDNKEVN